MPPSPEGIVETNLHAKMDRPFGVDPARVHPKVKELHARAGFGIVQRTQEWLDARSGLLTASDCAAALGVKPFKSYSGCPRADLLKKKLANEPLKSVFLAHGVHYEDAAQKATCAAMGEQAVDFGLIRHPKHAWLGASPDGVFPISGRCLELKAPLKRDLEIGAIPRHYYAQVQIQMQCLDLQSTIFAEYKPGCIMPDGKDRLNICCVERCDQWFEAALPKLRSFMDELLAARKTYIPRAPKLVAPTRIVDDLYEDDI